MKRHMTYWLTAALSLIPTLFLSAAEPEAGVTPPVVPPEVPAARTLRVSFAQNREMSDLNLKNNINDWTVPASAETGWCNIIPSRFKESGKISHTDVTVAPRVLRWTDGTLSSLSIHIYTELCGIGIQDISEKTDTDKKELANDKTVAAYFPRGKDTVFSPITAKWELRKEGQKETVVYIGEKLKGADGNDRAGYVVGAPAQYNEKRGGPGYVEVCGLRPGVSYQVVVLGGRPNTANEESTTYSVFGGEVSGVQVLREGGMVEKQCTVKENKVTVPMPSAGSKDFNGYWALMEFTVKPTSDTLKVVGTKYGHIIALSLKELPVEMNRELVYTSALATAPKDYAEIKPKTSGTVTANVLYLPTSPNDLPSAWQWEPLAPIGLKLTDGKTDSPWTVAVGPNEKPIKTGYGLKTTGGAAALLKSGFTQEAAIVERELAPLDLIVGASSDSPNLGCPIQNDRSAPWMKVGNVTAGRYYTLTALVGRNNKYNDSSAPYSVEGATVLHAEIVAEHLDKSQKPGLVENGVITANSTPMDVKVNAQVWTLMRFDVRATGPTLTLKSDKTCGNFKALKVSEWKAFNEREPMTVTFETRAKSPAVTLAGDAYATVANGTSVSEIKLDPGKVVRTGDKEYTNSVKDEPFYYNPDSAYKQINDGKMLSVNTRLYPQGGWCVDIPVCGIDSERLMAYSNRVRADIFTSNASGTQQVNNYKVQYRIELIDSNMVFAATDWTEVFVAKDAKGATSKTALLKPVGGVKLPAATVFTLRCSMQSEVHMTFAGVRSLTIDASVTVPEKVTVNGKEEPVSDALRNAVYAAAGVETDLGEVTIVPGKVSGKDITAEQMNAAAELFDGIVVKQDAAVKTFAAEAAAPAKTVFEVGYDFGIADMKASGDTLTATVGLQGPNASSASLKDGVTVKLLKDGTETGAVFDRGTMTLTLGGFAPGEGVPKFTVKAVR